MTGTMRGSLLPLLFPLSLLVLVPCPALAARLLLMPFVWKSHVGELAHIGEALVQKGHEVHMVLPEHYPDIGKFRGEGSKVKVVDYTPIHPDYLMWPEEEREDVLQEVMEVTPIQDFRVHGAGFTEICLNVLESEDLERRVRALGVDLVIVDAFPMTRCYMVLLYRLGLPYVSVTTQYEPWLFRNPALPSFVPFPLHAPALSPDMSFLQRLSNAWTLLDWTYRATELDYLTDALVAKYAPHLPAVTLNELAGRSLLWLYDTDTAIDYPRPIMPNEINIGGLSVQDASPLPQDLQDFVAAAPKGTIVASFGSQPVIPESHMLLMLDALARLGTDYHVVFRWAFDSQPPVPAHIRLLSWLPQNDVIGHPNTKLFITHCGANGQFEALYHGVPMLNVPTFGDQPYNARRADYHGFSESVDILTLTSDTFYATLVTLLATPTYHDNIRRASAIFRSQPLTPRARAAWWIEHVLQYGGQHLRSHALDMPAYQYLMLDLLGFVFLVLLAGLALLRIACSCLGRLCSPRHRQPPLQTENNNNEACKKHN